MSFQMNGHKFRAHVPLVPEPLEGDDGPISRQLRQERAIPFVYDVVADGQALVFEWVISSVEDYSAGADSFLNMPGTTKELFPGCTREEYEAPFIVNFLQTAFTCPTVFRDAKVNTILRRASYIMPCII